MPLPGSPAARLGRMVALSLMLITFARTAQGQTVRRVPQDHATIQQAIDACNDGDIVELDAGTWTGSGLSVVDILNLSVTIRNAPDTTPIIDGESVRHGIRVVGSAASTLTLEGLEFTRGNAVKSGDGGGLSVTNQNATVILTECLFTENQASGRGGACFVNASATLDATNCEFHANDAGTDGGAIAADGDTSIVSCILDDNQAGVRGGAVVAGGTLVVLNCGFGDDVAPVGAAIGRSASADISIEGSTFCGLGDDPIEGDWSDLGGNEFLASCPIPSLVVATDGSGDYTTIEDAVDAAESGATIEIRPGTYRIASNAPIDLGVKALSLVGDSSSSTIIESAAGSTVLLTSSNVATPVPVRLERLTFRNGGSSSYQGAVILRDRDVTIELCRFQDNPQLALQVTNCDLAMAGTAFLGNGIAVGDGVDVDWPDFAPTNRGLTVIASDMTSNDSSFRIKVLGPISIDTLGLNSSGSGLIAGATAFDPLLDAPIVLDGLNLNTASLTVGLAGGWNHRADATLTSCFVRNGSLAVDHAGGKTTLAVVEVCGGDLRIDNVLADATNVCVSESCDDVDDNGVPDGCESVDDGVHRVPEEFATIQEAVGYAGWDDVVEVGPGEWTIGGEGGTPLSLPTGPITIRGATTAAETVIRVSSGGFEKGPGISDGVLGATFERCTIITEGSKAIGRGFGRIAPLTFEDCDLQVRSKSTADCCDAGLSTSSLTLLRCDVMVEGDPLEGGIRAGIVRMTDSLLRGTPAPFFSGYPMIGTQQFICTSSTILSDSLAVAIGDYSGYTLTAQATIEQSEFQGGAGDNRTLTVFLRPENMTDGQQILIRDSTFEGLRGGWDGQAISLQSYSAAGGDSAAEVRIERCDFIDCTTESDGGAIEIEIDHPGISVTIDDCDFIGCSADETGGAIAIEAGLGSVEIVNSRFTANLAGFYGGAIDASRPITVRSGEFQNNVAIAEGGAISLSGPGESLIESVDFRENYALLAGGAISAGQTGLALSGGTMQANVAQYGGGIWALDATLSLSGASFSNNQGYLRGGALECLGSTAMLSNLQVSGNRSSEGAGGVQAIALSVVSVQDSDFCSNRGDYEAVDDFQTDESSSWVDLGGNTFAPKCLGGCPTDLNGDATTDGADLGMLFIEWGACPPEGCAADFNGDGEVGGADLGLLFVAWGPCS